MRFPVVTVLVCVYGLAQACNIPPSLWCSSPEIARQCRVTELCEKYTSPRVSAPVNVTLYYEYECNACRAFISSQLYKTYQTLGPSVMNVTLVPYGNAKEKKTIFGKWEFTCQHGQEECTGNIIEACAMSLNTFSGYFPFIHCLETGYASDDPVKDAKKCANKVKIDIDPVMQCLNSDKGPELEHEMALVTAALNPPHTYVPWVTFNGLHDEKMENKSMTNLLEVICKMYQGERPAPCNKVYEF